MPAVRYVEVEDTTWPIPSGLEWVQRYGRSGDVLAQRMGVASVVGSYSYLTDPQLPEKDAVAALKRARRAAAKAVDGST